jgi:hypothetical protein
MYKLILVVFLAVSGSGPSSGSVSVSEREIGQYPSKKPVLMQRMMHF